MKILILLFMSFSVLAGVPKFKPGSELSDKVKIVDSYQYKFKPGSELSDKVKIVDSYQYKFKPGSELSDKVKSAGHTHPRKKPGRTKLIVRMINQDQDLHHEICKEDQQKYADLKKLADELVNLTVKCSQDIETALEKKDLKYLKEVVTYCEEKTESLHDDLCSLDSDCDGVDEK